MAQKIKFGDVDIQIPSINFKKFGGLIPLLVNRKSTRLNSSHALISYAVFCLKKKKMKKKMKKNNKN